MSTDEWRQISRLIDYVMAQPSGKAIKESPGVTAVRGEPPRKTKRPKSKKEQPPEQLRLF